MALMPSKVGLHDVEDYLRIGSWNGVMDVRMQGMKRGLK